MSMTRANVRPIEQQLDSFVNYLFFSFALNESHYSRLPNSFETIDILNFFVVSDDFHVNEKWKN